MDIGKTDMRGGALAARLALLAAQALLLSACGKTSSPETSATVSASTEAVPTASSAPEGAAAPEPSATAPIAETPDPGLQAASYPPRDDCAGKPGWSAFHTALSAAVNHKDAKALAALTAKDVKLDFAGGSGAKELKTRLTKTDPELWGDLTAIMPLGCGLQGGLATMPWIFAGVPDSIDPYQGMLVVGTSVPLRKAASATAPEVAKLDWALVEIDPMRDSKSALVKVSVPGTRLAGYIEAKRLRSLLATRIIAEPQGGTWRITAIVAGD
jgi:hypothetical protein